MKLRILEQEFSDLQLNLALEHSILQTQAVIGSTPSVRFWRSPNSVVIGRTQMIKAEINEEFCRDNSIQIGRRISGGGAVFHDPGNLNTSFFFPLKLLKKLSIPSISEFFTRFMHETLQHMGYEKTKVVKRNSIIDGTLKISGSASYTTRSWILHHATLLFDCNLDFLEKSLRNKTQNPKNPRSSRYMPTKNIKDLNIDYYKSWISQNLMRRFNLEIDEQASLIDEIDYANHLAEKLYRNDEWIIHGKRILTQREKAFI